MSTPPTCECCHSPLGKSVDYLNTRRTICAECLGFIARWWMEIQTPKTTYTLQPETPPHPTNVVTIGDFPPSQQ